MGITAASQYILVGPRVCVEPGGKLPRRGRKGENVEKSRVDEMIILREGGRDAGIEMGLFTALSEPHQHRHRHPTPLPSFSSLTIRLLRKPHIVAISVQCPCVSAFLPCSCLIDTLATHKICFPDF